jgi:hypothetical protein
MKRDMTGSLACGMGLCAMTGIVLSLPKQTMWSALAAALFFVAGMLAFYQARFDSD